MRPIIILSGKLKMQCTYEQDPPEGPISPFQKNEPTSAIASPQFFLSVRVQLKYAITLTSRLRSHSLLV
jgi:hypothetical protein